MSRFRRLILAPHCDDETLGCGGLLAKYPEECVVVVAARPEKVRAKEFFAAQQLLGYQDDRFLNLADGSLQADMRGLVGALDSIMAEFQPDQLYVPFPSLHQDHIACYEAGVRAARLSMTPGHWFTSSIFAYDVAAYDINLYPTHLEWNVFETLSEIRSTRRSWRYRPISLNRSLVRIPPTESRPRRLLVERLAGSNLLNPSH